jgi:hypothetical protein
VLTLRPLTGFMTLPPYSKSREGEGQELGFGVRNGSHTARSRPVEASRESSERPCPATSAEEAAGSRIPWALLFQVEPRDKTRRLSSNTPQIESPSENTLSFQGKSHMKRRAFAHLAFH